MAGTGGDGWWRRVRLPGGRSGDPWAELAASVLPGYLAGRRWYAAKDKGSPAVEVARLAGFPPPLAHDAVLALLRVTPPGQAPQLYQLPLRAVPTSGAETPLARVELDGAQVALVDAAADPTFAAGLAQAFADGSHAGGAVAFRATGRLPEAARDLTRAEARPGSAEQSNSSVRYGDAAILKLFRKLEPGTHPELEVGRFLTEVAGYANTPPLLGWAELPQEGSGEPAVLAVLQRLVPGAEDGWSHLLDRLRVSRDPEATLEFARLLGRRTAEMHRAFVAPTDDPAFAPEPVGPEVLRSWGEGVRAMADRALDGLSRAAADLEPPAKAQAERLLARRDDLLARVGELVPDRLEAARTRLHGDYHLGQVIVAGGGEDVFVIDFEGEPMRPLAERRAKHSPLRDVAGMLRSFAYAAATVAGEGAAPADRLAAWREAASAVFLDAYWAAVGDCPSVPADRAGAERLLRLFLLEKALYEVGYELANRPAWVGIPVEGVLDLLDEGQEALPDRPWAETVLARLDARDLGSASAGLDRLAGLGATAVALAPPEGAGPEDLAALLQDARERGLAVFLEASLSDAPRWLEGEPRPDGLLLVAAAGETFPDEAASLAERAGGAGHPRLVLAGDGPGRPGLLERTSDLRPLRFAAQRSGDLAQALDAVAAGGVGLDLAALGRALTEGFLSDKEPAAHLPPTAFVASLGSAPAGEAAPARAAASLLLLAPTIPTLPPDAEGPLPSPWLREVLELRRRRVAPLVPEILGNAAAFATFGATGLEAWWRTGDGRKLRVAANLGPEPLAGAPPPRGEVFRRENGAGGGGGDGLAPWEVVWSIEEPSALDRLALRMGIEPSYGNAMGRTVHATDETKRALLAAMGVEAADEDQARASLEAYRRAEGARLLPPVLVVREDRLAGAAVPLNLPPAAGSGRATWTLTEEGGRERRGEAEGSAVRLPDGVPPGYHRLRVEAARGDGGSDDMPLIVAPRRCYLPPPLERGERLWGISAQVYTIRSAPDWGIGDFGDLANLMALAASRGAAVVAVNPLHALFLDDPDRASPYSPASRSTLNPLYVDVTAVPELMDCQPVLATIASAEFQGRINDLAAQPHVGYRAVAELKLPLLEALFAQFQASATPERRAAFAAFREELGEPLERFCLFQALRERFAAEDPSQPAWQNWPEPFREGPDAPEVVRFRERHQERVDFFAWLQWVADAQLAAAARGGDGNGGLAIGICRDLAVGADAAGAETWANRGVVVPGASVGAPPDIFNPAGQNWGLPPFAPAALRAEGYRSFVDMVRANMRHAGALRIDHILGLQHFFWIPQGRSAGEGAYVAYPLEDLLGILALESHRHRCLVVGEDLGTVPKLLRERMPDYGLLGYRVVFFEWTDDGRFKGPGAYDRLAFSTIASHDLATLRGWWEGRDIDAKAERGLYPSPDEEASQRGRRAADRSRFVDALRAARLSLRPSFGPDWPWSDSLGVAAHAFLARTRSAVAMVQLDDLTGEPDQVNLPGTVDEYPNWRRKLSMTLEEFARDERACALMSLLAAARTTG